MVDAGHEPCLPRQHAHFRREERRPRIARLESVDRLGEIAEQFGMVDVEEFQQQADVVAWLLEQFHQPVLDLDVVLGLGEAEASRSFQGPLAGRIQLADKTLEIKSGHNGRPFQVLGGRVRVGGFYRSSAQKSIAPQLFRPFPVHARFAAARSGLCSSAGLSLPPATTSV